MYTYTHVTAINEKMPWIWKRARSGIWEGSEGRKRREKSCNYNFKNKNIFNKHFMNTFKAESLIRDIDTKKHYAGLGLSGWRACSIRTWLLVPGSHRKRQEQRQMFITPVLDVGAGDRRLSGACCPVCLAISELLISEGPVSKKYSGGQQKTSDLNLWPSHRWTRTNMYTCAHHALTHTQSSLEDSRSLTRNNGGEEEVEEKELLIQNLPSFVNKRESRQSQTEETKKRCEPKVCVHWMTKGREEKTEMGH